MQQQLSLSGIYDKRTLSFLVQQGIKRFTFDFRPRSENFIQKYVFSELLSFLDSQTNSQSFKVNLYFQNEVDFMIKDILAEFEFSSIRPTLYLNCDEDTKYYESLGVDINWYYDPESRLDQVLKSGHLKAITFPYHLLEQINDKGQLPLFLSNLNVKLAGRTKAPVKFHLTFDWSSNLSTSILDYFHFDSFMLPISRELEVCYRNVDLPKLKNSISIFKV